MHQGELFIEALCCGDGVGAGNCDEMREEGRYQGERRFWQRRDVEYVIDENNTQSLLRCEIIRGREADGSLVV